MNAIKRMGVLYGKLGLATDARIIEARGAGVKAAAKALKAVDVPKLVQCVFGLKSASDNAPFLSAFTESDPTFDVQPGDSEVALLAACVAAYEMERGTAVGGQLALTVVAASLGGMRPPVADDLLLDLGNRVLADQQGHASKSPDDRKYNKQPQALLDAIATLEGTALTTTVQPHVTAAIDALGKYAEAGALAAAKSDNDLLGYIRRLEAEANTYWWVSGGWSKDASKPFRDLPSVEAAVRAAKELSEKTSGELGLFAAPALLDMVIERGRTPTKPVPITEVAVATDRTWRAPLFETAAAGAYADLFPLVTALGMAASSEDATDWQPRYKRLTNIDPKKKLGIQDIAIQMYRECLVLRRLG